MTTKDTGVIRAPVDPEYCLFLKCIRGDTSDNIFSAYPGVRENGTKNKIGIREAFEDRNAQGYKWVNFMLQRWADKDEVEHYVKDRYEFNRKLIDLREQPDDIKLKCIDAILTATSRPPVQAAGLSFLRFCKTWNLLKIGNDAELYMAAINKRYNT